MWICSYAVFVCCCPHTEALLTLKSLFLGGMQTGLEERCLSGSCKSSLQLPKGWMVMGESVSLSSSQGWNSNQARKLDIRLDLDKVCSRWPEREKTVWLGESSPNRCMQQGLHVCKAGVTCKGLKPQELQDDPESCFSSFVMNLDAAAVHNSDMLCAKQAFNSHLLNYWMNITEMRMTKYIPYFLSILRYLY